MTLFANPSPDDSMSCDICDEDAVLVVTVGNSLYLCRNHAKLLHQAMELILSEAEPS